MPCPRARAGRRGLAHQSGLRRGGVPLLEVQRLSPLHRQPRPAAQVGAGGTRAPFAKPPQGGRHSVASQAVTGGESVKAVQAQLGHRSEQSTHKYAYLGSGAQKRLIETLRPKAAPHEAARSAHGNVGSTSERKPRPRNFMSTSGQRRSWPTQTPPSNKSKKALISQGLFVLLRGGATRLS